MHILFNTILTASVTFEFMLLYIRRQFIKNAELVAGVVTDCNKTDETSTVSFNFNNEFYDVKVYRQYKDGDKVELYVNRDCPVKYIHKSIFKSTVPIPVFFCLCALIGIGFCIR